MDTPYNPAEDPAYDPTWIWRVMDAQADPAWTPSAHFMCQAAETALDYEIAEHWDHGEEPYPVGLVVKGPDGRSVVWATRRPFCLSRKIFQLPGGAHYSIPAVLTPRALHPWGTGPLTLETLEKS